MDRGVGDADRAHQSELGLHEQILQRIFGDRGQRPFHAERAAAMAHGVKLEIAECDALHLAIGRMVVDPVLVAAEAVRGVEHRRMLVGGAGEFIQPAARQLAEAMEMRFQPPEILRLQVQPEQIAQAAIDLRKNSVPRSPARCDRGRGARSRLRRTICEGEARACLTSCRGSFGRRDFRDNARLMAQGRERIIRVGRAVLLRQFCLLWCVAKTTTVSRLCVGMGQFRCHVFAAVIADGSRGA